MVSLQGPCLVTSDEIRDPNTLGIKTTLRRPEVDPISGKVVLGSAEVSTCLCTAPLTAPRQPSVEAARSPPHSACRWWCKVVWTHVLMVYRCMVR